MKLSYRIKDFTNSIKFFFQRGARGYCDKDVWSIDAWFLDIMPKMLRQLKTETHGAPCLPDVSSEECFDKWKEILNRMIYLLREMDEDKCSYKNPFAEAFHEYVEKQFSGDKDFKENPDLRKLYVGEECNKVNYINMCKEEFFELFSKYFWDLWD